MCTHYSADARMNYDVFNHEQQDNFSYFPPQNCYGFEERLTDCPKSGNSCPSANPAGVTCSGIYNYTNLLVGIQRGVSRGVLWVLQHHPCANASTYIQSKPSEKNMLRKTNHRIFLQRWELDGETAQDCRASARKQATRVAVACIYLCHVYMRVRRVSHQ